MHLLMCAWHRLRQIQSSDHSCLIEHSFYENYPVFNHARKLGVTLQAERLRETKRWTMPLRFRLCCLGVVVAVSGWWLLSRGGGCCLGVVVAVNEAHLIFLIFPFWPS